jgi:hypothetical protein
MSEETVLRDLFDRWERVWQEGQLNLVTTCVTEQYTRHDENGDRTVTRDAYAKEVAQIQAERQKLRVVVYDHTFKDDRAWLRFAFKWTDSNTGETYSRAGMQSYKIEGGKLAESWLSLMPLGSTWTDTVGQEHWTSPPPIKSAKPEVAAGRESIRDRSIVYPLCWLVAVVPISSLLFRRFPLKQATRPHFSYSFLLYSFKPVWS